MDDLKIEGLISDAEEGMNVGYRTPTFADDESEEVSLEEEEQPDEEVQKDEEVSSDDDEELDETDDEDESEDDKPEEEFLVKKVSKELEQERKELHRVYMGRLKELAGLRSKAALVDQINQNPQQVLPALAQRLGVELQPRGQQGQRPDAPTFQPKVDSNPREGENMADYIKRLMSESFAGLPEYLQQTIQQSMQGLQPAQQSASRQQLTTNGTDPVISYLDQHHSDWPMYEKEMVELVTKHPTYAQNPGELYRQAKALHTASGTQAAKVAKKGKGKKGVARAKTKVQTSAKPKGKTTWDQAWEAAKKDLVRGG